MTKEELMQALEQNGSASSMLMKELLTVVEAEIKEAAKPKPLLVTSLNTTQEYSRHEMAMHLGITEDQLMQILRGEITAVTDEHFTLYVSGHMYNPSMGLYNAVFGEANGDFGYSAEFSGDTDSNTYKVQFLEV